MVKTTKLHKCSRAFWKVLVLCASSAICSYTCISLAPIECFIMQGEYPLPAPVIEKFAKTSGALTKNVFLLREPHVGELRSSK